MQNKKEQSVDPEMKSEFKNLHDKIDGYMEHQSEICTLRHDSINVHLVEAPGFRDKIIKVLERIGALNIRMNWLYFAFTSIVIGGIVLGIWVKT